MPFLIEITVSQKALTDVARGKTTVATVLDEVLTNARKQALQVYRSLNEWPTIVIHPAGVELETN